MRAALTQLLPPKPEFTEENLPSLDGKVFLITGGNAGVGLELVKMLYARGGTVYVACRSPTKFNDELDDIKSMSTTPGKIKTLQIDLNDLRTVPTCVSAFLAQESRLDVLWNNAGITTAPGGTVTVQGHEAHMGVNCLGHYLLTTLLLPILTKTAAASTKNTVRVVFLSSGIIDLKGPPGGISLAELQPGNHSQVTEHNYSASKAGAWFLASEFDRRLRPKGVICLAVSPGTLRTKGWDNASWVTKLMMRPFMHEPKLGAYTELWAGLSADVKSEDGGRYGIPWGRWHPSPKKELLDSLARKDEGGTGLAGEFWNWCAEKTHDYAL